MVQAFWRQRENKSSARGYLKGKTQVLEFGNQG